MHLLLETVSVPFLPLLWFILVAVLWVGFFFLEGFDFGVAMLLPVLGKTDKDRRVVVNTIGPTWDGNEVWLLTAGGAMFAAFPGWYASLFSALYLPLLLVLVGLILRGVAFEYRSKHHTSQYKRMLDAFATWGSFLTTLVLGVGFANFIVGLPNDGLLFDGTFFGLFTPFTLLGGVLLVAIFVTHGTAFLALKTKGEIHDRAKALGVKVGWVTVALLAVFVVSQNVFWPATSEVGNLPVVTWALGVISIVSLAVAVVMIGKDRDGWAFVFTGASIATLFVGIFVRLFGNLGFAQDETVAVAERLTILSAASSETTLTIMSFAALVFVPLVLGYQAWSYWVFRKRISTKNIPDEVEAAH